MLDTKFEESERFRVHHLNSFGKNLTCILVGSFVFFGRNVSIHIYIYIYIRVGTDTLKSLILPVLHNLYTDCLLLQNFLEI